ncbi:MAG TPA: hypothetical protein VMR34_04880 [Candidatus Saccharimonadales bacterium]|nr:hypothetical protein [Candidatus Saccharimonadales bacterium]
MLADVINKIAGLIRSRRFLLIVLAFFIFESIWIAFSAVYPQAFDENFHFGLIQIYSHYWLPFLNHQPPNANAFGAVARDPSYLYHYLMSFPYRFIALFTHSQTVQIILLRLIDIVLFGIGLVLFHKALIRAGFSRSIANVSILFFVLIPVVPQLAAQINYDDLLFPLVSWTCLLSFDVIGELKRKRPSTRTILTWSIVCLFTGMVKYAFLPIFLAEFLFLGIMAYRTYKGKLKTFFTQLLQSFTKLSHLTKTLLVALLLLGVGLFIQRDGVNLIKYHSIAPNCASVLNVHDCSAYSAWDYNYNQHLQVSAKTISASDNLAEYTGNWLYWMWYRLFFAVNGPNSAFTNYPPLPIPSATAALIGVAGIGAIIKWRRRLFHNNPYTVFLVVISLIYVLVLFLQGYSSYRYTAILENQNGRYLLPILILVTAVAAQAFNFWLRKRLVSKVVLVVLVLALFLQGGGFLTFITRSDPTWDWSNSTVLKVNNTARKITNKVVVNGSKSYSTSRWFFN